MYVVLLLLALIATDVSASPETDSFPSGTADLYANWHRAKRATERDQAQEIAVKEQRFVESFNRLAKALDDFSKTYKATRVIDVKKVESIKEAYRKLESADAWFRIQ